MRLSTLVLAAIFGVLPGCTDDGKDSDDTGPDVNLDDVDGDGLPADEDCDDADASVGGPTAAFADADADGYGDAAAPSIACAVPEGHVADATDCDDTDAAVNPGAVEVCNDIDDDCDAAVDDADASLSDPATWYADADGDTFGVAETSLAACDQPAGYTALAGDCDDADTAYRPDADESDCADPNDYNCDGSVGYADADGDGYAACEECDDLEATTHPGADESCDGVDNDCDAILDEADAVDASTWYADADVDGYGDAAAPSIACAVPEGHVADATDCDDTDAAVNPDAVEVCNDIDDDCDAAVDDADDSVTGQVTSYTDADGDGFGADTAPGFASCLVPPGSSTVADDCDDTSSVINPTATEICDAANTDEDCDGAVDDADAGATGKGTWYADADGDTFGDADDAGALWCDPAAGLVADHTDCDDTRSLVNPDGTETCNTLDDNCDGAIDGDDSADVATWYADADADGYGAAGTTELACDVPSGFVADATDCDDGAAAINPAAIEVCDSADTDEDCDGAADDADSIATGKVAYYPDSDRDTFGDADDAGALWCDPAAGLVADHTDCDDTRSLVNPDGTETCNTLDDNCDGAIDGDDSADVATWYADADGDTYGDASVTDLACYEPAGFVADDQDCDDTATTVNPMGTETCNSGDDDCDGTVDEDATDRITWYRDADADLYGNAGVTALECEVPAGYVAIADDCNDAAPGTNPSAAERCDSANTDEDCDGTADDLDTAATGKVRYYTDADADSYGAGSGALYCDPASGLVTNVTDCDDTRAAVNPVATETCNTLDDNCDGAIDGADSADRLTWHADADGDTYGDASVTDLACYEPAGFVADDQDCDDGAAAVSPDGTELCNGIDDNCDGTTDEDDAVDAMTWYLDTDGDGYGDADASTSACAQPSGYVADGTDCDTEDPAVYDCHCTLTAVGTPTTVMTDSTSFFGAWMVDPLETLGAGLVWDMDHVRATSLVEYASQAAMVAHTPSRTMTLPYQAAGTGGAVYDGYLYYNEIDSRNLVRYDIATGASSRLSIPDAGYSSTYAYMWGGLTDFDVAVDEYGVWLIYGTAANSGRIVVSKIHEATFTIEDTWNTGSDPKRELGNAWMQCGVLYTTDDMNSATTTVNYAYDTSDESSWNPGIAFSNPRSYTTSVNYNPTDGLLRAWGAYYRHTYTTTAE